MRNKAIAFFIITLCFIAAILPARAQELNCNVQVMSPKLQTAEAQIFKTLENAIYEFLNTRKWTNDVFSVEERIECSILINVTDELGSDKYRATLTVQSSRPVMNSSYNTTIINHVDRDWVFEYTEHQPLEFNENVYISNLTSMLAYWAYVVIGMDYDTFSPKGGTDYFVKAQNIVNSIPANLSSDDAPGWKPFDSNRNRYWLVENLLNSKFEVMRDIAYEYHRLGMDMMYENVNMGRQAVFGSLQKLENLSKEYPNNMLKAMFFNAKSDELTNIFSKAPPAEKAAAVQLLYRMDASNASKYANILKN